jgi:hypothetical protein
VNELVPNRLLIDVEITLNHRPKPPVIDGALDGWTDRDLLPPLYELDGQLPFAQLWMCWNDRGLYLGCQVLGKRKTLKCDRKAFWKGDNIRLCTDMRDARRNKRASRFCQQFFLLPTGGTTHELAATAGSAKIHRAREDAPLFSSENGEPESKLEIVSTLLPDGYNLEAHIPASCLIGFDPVEHPRIGLYYIVEDLELGQQFLTVGDDMNWHVDPSTWAVARLGR